MNPLTVRPSVDLKTNLLKSSLKFLLTAFVLMSSLIWAASLSIAQEEDEAAKKQNERQTKCHTAVNDGDGNEMTLHYWLYLPDEYDAKDESKGWPVLLFLHGRGECGDDLNLVKKWGPPKFLDNKGDFPFIVISPQCPTPGWDVDALKDLMDHIVGHHQVDVKRFYVTGLSMGGFGTWKFTAKYPQFVAAAIPICGGGDARMAESLVNVPIWAFHGDNDVVVPLAGSENMVGAIKSLKGEKVKLTVYPGVGHNSWSKTYANDEIYEWLLKQKLETRDK